MNVNLQAQSLIKSNEQNMPVLADQSINNKQEILHKNHKFYLIFIVIVVIIFILQILRQKIQKTSQLQQPQEQDLSDIFNNKQTQKQSLNAMIQLFKQKYHSQVAQQALGKALNANNEAALKIQYDFFNDKYNLQSIKSQKFICIVASQRNNDVDNRQKIFLDSVRHLNYTNYRLVIIDDASADQTIQVTQKYLQQFQQFAKKVIFIQNQERQYSLANKIKGIHHFCQENDIIIDVDADDHFIGREILKIINKIYQNSQIWFFYTNYLTVINNQCVSGNNRQITKEQRQDYRASGLWLISHLKTYRQELFMKLDQSDWKKSGGQYYHWAADRFIIYGLTQLAGEAHQYFDNIYPYFYEYQTNHYRNFDIIKPDKYKSMIVTPYNPLNSLIQQPTKKQNYKIPQKLQNAYKEAKEKYNRIIQRYKAEPSGENFPI